ncbi:MAG TPA: cytochrome C [Mucilaginibacter sp.]|jgi:mono/diheme cytochrome c family protein|nr:cytochrome C [Mucilaginibacter sp.]
MRSFSLIFKQFSRSVLLIAGFAFLGFSAYAQGDAAKGEALYKAKCSACHKIDIRVVGPALGQIVTAETDDKWLAKWVQNSQGLIAAKDPKALKIFNEYNQAGMTAFAELSDGDVADIMAYTRTTWKTMQAVPAPGTVAGQAAGTAAGQAAATGPSNLVVFSMIGIIVLAFIIILVLNKVIARLERLLLKNKGLFAEEAATQKAPVDRLATVKKLAKNKKLVFFVLLCGTLAFCSWGWVTMWNTNIHQGYQPVQPIKFAHDLHAGAMKIDCQYCHSGAYKSKNASIPSLNVCMNCHKTIDRALNSKTASTEIQKIYDALGYDPQTQKYDSTKARPVQWVRIHNLPDFVYFNHSQHVVAGKQKCQTCHGQIQEMKEVYQYSPLTMKWCVQCHKRTKVDFKGNAYYTNLEQVHKLLGEHKPVSVAVMGGIECSKCHY